MNINLGQSHRNNCELDHLQDVDMSNGVDRDGDYDNDDENYDNGDGHIDIESLQDHIIKISGTLVG